MDWRSVSAGGIVIALLGFFLTRFTVSLAAMDTQRQFLLAGVVPLVLGLGLAAFGVVLAVGRYEPSMVRTTAAWSLVGTGSMFVLVVLTLLGTDPAVLTDMAALRERTILSNFLIGGAIGGTLTGIYAAQNRRQRRDVQQQANRLVLLNRLLRDQVINAATAIKGHTDVLEHTENDQSVRIIDRQAENVIQTVENVKYLTRTRDESGGTTATVDLAETVRAGIEAAETQHPDADCTFQSPDQPVAVFATEQLTEVVRHLVENAIEYSDGDSPSVEIAIETTRRSATIRVSDNGPGLPVDQQALLEEGTIAEFDDPTTGFGLNIVRLLVESFDGSIDTLVSDGGSTVAVELRRPGEGGVGSTTNTSLTTPGIAPSRIALAMGASLVAGVTMGVVMQQFAGTVPVIGALYGVEDPLVGWITHEFHSIIFGLVYAAALSTLPLSYTRGVLQCVGLAVAFGVALWAVAAGIIMPVWLQFVGIDIGLPNLTAASFVGHVVWGVTLGTIYHVGNQWLVQWSN